MKEIKDENFTSEQIVDLERYVECRLARVPIQYIIGEWDFYSLKLKMTPTVFIPRPETEELVSMILKDLENTKKGCFLEVGPGTGAISISLLSNLPEFQGFALERSKLAAKLTIENSKALNVDERLKVLNSKLEEGNINKIAEEFGVSKFDMIVSNPPYIPSKQVFQLQPEITL